MNKTLASWLSVVVVFLCLPLYAFTSGDGSYENPYEIAGQSDIVNLIDMVATNDCSGLYFLQTADIDLSVFGTTFQGIGGISSDMSITNAFSGDYDGDGYWISNMFMTAYQPNNVSTGLQKQYGFFNLVNGATIQNLCVQGTITGGFYRANASFGSVAGGIVAIVRGSTILENIVSDVDISLDIASVNQNNFHKIGGVIGEMKRGGSITYTRIINKGDITLRPSYSGGAICGGVFGYWFTLSGGENTFNKLENYGTITCSSKQSGSAGSLLCGVGYLYGPRGVLANGVKNYGNIVVDGGSGYSINGCFGVSTEGASTGRYYYLANYGSITARIDGELSETSSETATGVCGLAGGQTYSFRANSCTNFADISVLVNLNSQPSVHEIAGCFLGIFKATSEYAKSCVNLGNISFSSVGDKNPNEVAIAGITTPSKPEGNDEIVSVMSCVNYGDLYLAVSNHNLTAGKYDVAGVSTPSRKANINTKKRQAFIGNSGNFGKVKLYLEPTLVNAMSVVSGVESHYSEGYSDVIATNCYNLGKLEWSGKNIYVGGIGGMAIDTTANTEYAHYRNCYSVGEMEGETEGNFVGSLVGCVSNVLGAVSISNCFAISQYPAFGAFYGGSTNNNVASYTYEQFYRNPNSQAFLYNYAFTNSGRDTNSFYDLALPINKLLFPTITEEIKQKHNWTRLNGYKRYIRTIQQQ